MHPRNLLLLAAVLLAPAGCSKGEANAATISATPAPAPVPTPVAAPAAPAVTEAPKPVQKVELAIESVGNTMTFSKATLSAPAGAEVHLTFKNNSTMSTLPHNWVLVRKGTEADVAAAGLKRGEPAGYIDVTDSDILAHTPMAKPGETTEVTFTAPAPGSYAYICSVPGHYMMMKGVFTVTP